MKYFRVCNWAKFQHYKDRNPPWIKLHNSTLECYEFSQLPDASKGHLFAIWLLASRSDNCLRADSNWIKERIGARTKVDLQILKEYGFIEEIPLENSMLHNSEHNASNMQAKCYTERETEREQSRGKQGASDDAFLICKGGKKINGDQYQRFMAFWDAFKMKRGKAEAAEEWRKLSPDQETAVQIIRGAQREAEVRPLLVQQGKTPKWAQGWLSGRRWEDSL